MYRPCINACLLNSIFDDFANSLAETSFVLSDGTDYKILPTAKEKGYQLLIELVGERRIAAVPELLKALNDSDPAIRAAALTSLGETVPLDRLSLLVSQVVAPKYAEDAPIAAQALIQRQEGLGSTRVQTHHGGDIDGGLHDVDDAGDGGRADAHMFL